MSERHGNGSLVSAERVRGVKPTRTPRISILAVPCPDCRADVGVRCDVSNSHRSRRRMAVRKAMEE